ncbi:hypothetical protein CHELA20_11228 [Hyphomicrobiales bacterium]|nr:hypothetical protein CHELA20_11228 [Hyphomicrobiales bacterium]
MPPISFWYEQAGYAQIAKPLPHVGSKTIAFLPGATQALHWNKATYCLANLLLQQELVLAQGKIHGVCPFDRRN